MTFPMFIALVRESPVVVFPSSKNALINVFVSKMNLLIAIQKTFKFIVCESILPGFLPHIIQKLKKVFSFCLTYFLKDLVFKIFFKSFSKLPGRIAPCPGKLVIYLQNNPFHIDKRMINLKLTPPAIQSKPPYSNTSIQPLQ